MKLSYLTALLIVAVIIASGALVWTVADALPTLKLWLVGDETEAVVREKTWVSTEGRRIVYQFRVSGQEYFGKIPVDQRLWTALDTGATIPIRYDVDNPANSRMRGFDLKSGGYLFQILISAVFLYLVSFGLYRSIYRRGRPVTDDITR